MLKYSHIINQLSNSDKIAILCDMTRLADKKYRALGIPQLHLASLEDACREGYLSPVELVNSWDPKLVYEVSKSVTAELAAKDADMVFVSGPKLKIDPYHASLSEDPHLSAVMSKSFLRGANECGLSVCLTDCSIGQREAQWLDVEPNTRFLRESVFKPFCDVASSGECVAVLTDHEGADTAYQAANRAMGAWMEAHFKDGRTVPVCRSVSHESTVEYLAKGGLALKASADAAEAALGRYWQLKKAIENGTGTTEKLEQELTEGKILSPEQLDAGVDRLLELAFAAKRKPSVSEIAENSELALRAARESVVLLKNTASILPMKKGGKVCIMGEIAMQEDADGNTLANGCARILSESGYSCEALVRGYALSEERDDDLLAQAVEAAKASDTVLLFLGFDKKRQAAVERKQKLSIPANQQKLLSALYEDRTKVIAVLSGECCPDVGLDQSCAALLFAPIYSRYAPYALTDVLLGHFNPCGKLTSSVYHNSEEQYIKHRTYRMRDGIKTGPFIGYRYYTTTEEYDGKYPFGHGLSYTQFSYSHLIVGKDSVSFTVKNTGRMAGSEVAQVYVGMARSAYIRPKRELVAFERIELKPNERKTVEFKIDLPPIYEASKDAFTVEKGAYTVEVGSSLTDLRLFGTLHANGSALAGDGEKREDYLHSESNIISHNYKLEAKHKTMKKSVFHFIAGGVALALAIALKLYCSLAGVVGVFFDLFAVALGIAGIVFFVVEAIYRNRLYREEKRMIEQQNAEMFRDAEPIPAYQAEMLFAKEFSEGSTIQQTSTQKQAEVYDTEYLAYIDQEQTFADSAKDFLSFATEKGYKFREETVKSLFAAMASSRLLIMQEEDDEKFRSLTLLMANYFGTGAHTDAVDASCQNGESLLFRTDANGERVKTSLFSAFEEAKNDPNSIHLAMLTDVRFAQLPLYFSSYIGYVKNPRGHHQISARNEKNLELTYTVPQNLWFIFNLAQGEALTDMPDFIADVATFNRISFEECHAVPRKESVRKFGYHQMEYLTEKAGQRYSMDEEAWKKLDRLEEYVNAHTPYHIGNKMWLCMERYVYSYLACDGEKAQALDDAVCAKMIPSMLSHLKGMLSEDEKSLIEVMDTIFGEGSMDACKQLIREYGSDIA